MKRLFIFLIMTIIGGCHPSDGHKVHITKEIEGLTNVEQQQHFLETVGELDQEVRHNETEMLKKHGYQSAEHKAALTKMMNTDRINLSKIEAYLKIHGHPKLDKHGKKACGTPWIVVHHAPGGVEPRERNFQYFYSAYKNGDIDDGALTFYLNRMYDIKFGKRIEWDRPFSAEEELDTLLTALNLWTIINDSESQ